MAKYAGCIHVDRDRSVMREGLVMRLQLDAERVSTVQQPFGKIGPILDEVADKALGWRGERVKTMSPIIFSMVMVALLGRTHPAEMERLGVQMPAPGLVRLRSIVRLAPFADLAGPKAEQALRNRIAWSFKAASPLKVAHNPACARGGGGKKSRLAADLMLSFDAEPGQITFSSEALDLALAQLAPEGRAETPRTVLTLTEILALSDDDAIAYLRGGLAFSLMWLASLLQDATRADRKMRELLRLIRLVWPYVGVVDLFVRNIEPKDHGDLAEVLREVASRVSATGKGPSK